jgi:hypothetical protein
MTWTPLDFGRYQGKTLPQVLFSDPDWFFWAVEEGAFHKRDELKAEAALLYERARRVRIPARYGAGAVAEYWIHPSSFKFARVEIVPGDKPEPGETSPTLRARVIDFSAPRRLAPYDKTGGRILIGNLKEILFGGNVRLTRARVEAFFSDPANFATGRESLGA